MLAATALLLATASFSQATPASWQPLADAPPLISPTIDAINMTGPGCPIGNAGVLRDMHNNTPIFAFSAWGMDLNDKASLDENLEASKFCAEEIHLGQGPKGYQVRVANVTVRGYAQLAETSMLGLKVETHLDGMTAGVSLPP